jgi:hypothetical protein
MFMDDPPFSGSVFEDSSVLPVGLDLVAVLGRDVEVVRRHRPGNISQVHQLAIIAWHCLAARYVVRWSFFAPSRYSAQPGGAVGVLLAGYRAPPSPQSVSVECDCYRAVRTGETGRRRFNRDNHCQNRADIGGSASAEMLEKTGW